MLEHQYPAEPDLLHRAAAAGAQFSVVSENLLRGDAALLTSAAGPTLIEQTWLSTPSHRANLLDPRLNAAGISLLRAGNTLTIVEDLARTSPDSLSQNGLASTEQAVAANLLTHGLAQATVTEAALAACASPAAPGTPTPVLTIAWDGPNPTTLPAALFAQLPHHTHAQLAACPGAATAQASPPPVSSSSCRKCTSAAHHANPAPGLEPAPAFSLASAIASAAHSSPACPIAPHAAPAARGPRPCPPSPSLP